MGGRDTNELPMRVVLAALDAKMRGDETIDEANGADAVHSKAPGADEKPTGHDSQAELDVAPTAAKNVLAGQST